MELKGFEWELRVGAGADFFVTDLGLDSARRKKGDRGAIEVYCCWDRRRESMDSSAFKEKSN